MKTRFLHIFFVLVAFCLVPGGSHRAFAQTTTNLSPELDPEYGKPFPTYYKIKDHIHSPLFQAIMEGNTVRAVEMIKAGTNVNEQIDGGMTPLMVSASMGQTSVVKELLAAKVFLDETNKDGRTSLMIAALRGKQAVVKILLEAKCNPEIQDSSGQTALILGVMSGKLSVVRLLGSQNKTLLNHRDKQGMTALAWAASSGFADSANFLIRQGADLAVTNNVGLSAWDYARITGKTNLLIIKR